MDLLSGYFLVFIGFTCGVLFIRIFDDYMEGKNE